jgi:hypothetical protein
MEVMACLGDIEMTGRSSSVPTQKRRLHDCMGISLVCVFVLIISLVIDVPGAVAGEDEVVSNNIEAVAPLRILLAKVQESYPGQVLEVELDKEEYDDRKIWVYEVKLLTKRGNVLKLEYDAINLELLKLKGKLDK